MISRKQFIRYLWVLVSSPFLFLFGWIYFSDKKNDSYKAKRIVDNPQRDGIYLFDDMVINISNNNINIFSRKCTHLGCKIIQSSDNNLICPCHGSVFTNNGKYVSGPAQSDLKKIYYHFNDDKTKLIIEQEN